MLACIRRTLGDTKFGVHVLVCIFAISSWADMNAMWSELPVLVTNLPEAWDLPSYIVIISQVANIGPLIFVIMATLLPRAKGKLDKGTSLIIIISDIVAVIFLSIYWKHTSHIAGRERSTALLSLNFVFALGDCTSSVAFYAFMSTLKHKYMSSLFLGEGLSGMLPAFLALAQGVSDIDCIDGVSETNGTFPNGTTYTNTSTFVYPKFGEPRFSVQVYFLTIAAILFMSFVSFILLNVLDYCKSEMVVSNKPEEKQANFTGVESVHMGNSIDNYKNLGNDDLPATEENELKKVPPFNLTVHLLMTIIINMTLTTFLASIQSYTTLPYGLTPYHLATNLAQIANPIACFFALFVVTKNLASIGTIFTLGQVAVAYIIYTAAVSPTPPLHGQDGGSVVIVILWVVVTLLLVYSKVCIAIIMRESGRRNLIWYGIATQFGSAIGAVVGFVLVNHYEVFTSAPYC